MTSRILTSASFGLYRAKYALQAMHSEVERFDGDIDQMSEADGLNSWRDGAQTAQLTKADAPPPPEISAKPGNAQLWVVTHDDVLYASELCDFGSRREANAVKHSNLTGGAPAHAGGEMLFVEDQTIVLNGCSGRYRVRNESEMKALASAFRASGYKVWSMGYNADTARPAMFGTQDPEWIAP